MTDVRVVGGVPLLVDDRYSCGPVIARGAVGEVRYGEDLQLGRPVAVKILDGRLAGDADTIERFRHEAATAAGIDHPNVVRVLDGGVADGLPYLVMECLPGATFADELSWGPCDEDRARRVAVDLLAGLGAVHALGIVHRDVKPSNLLISAPADGGVDGPLKLADFGVATTFASRRHDLTEVGMVVGTPAYLSPERVEGGAAGPASDLYSVGVVLYEALAGVQPFVSETPLGLAFAIHQGVHRPIAEHRPDLTPSFAAAIERALAADPAQRWSSAAAMAAAIDPPTHSVTAGTATEPVPALSFLPTEPMAALPVEAFGSMPTPGGSPSRWRPLVLVGGLALLATVALLILATHLRVSPAAPSVAPPGVSTVAPGTEPTTAPSSALPTSTTAPARSSTSTIASGGHVATRPGKAKGARKGNGKG